MSEVLECSAWKLKHFTWLIIMLPAIMLGAIAMFMHGLVLNQLELLASHYLRHIYATKRDSLIFTARNPPKPN
ncbi:hypothetical protein SDC9_20729 [bioreactor metagenome]|uniref:Uncharacterized protein n=1 Tax=bioreactor metagenome TaxID=1076179 RepID=A0A644U7L0_9ZZZZ